MITVDPKSRISAAEILKHDWIKKYENDKCCDETTPHEHQADAKAAI